MSRVTGVMLICSVLDEGEQPIREIIGWLDEHNWQHWYLKDVADHTGGSKHPQFAAYGGGFNGFDGEADEFAEFVLSREWEDPENVILILQPEEGVTRVFRPKDYE